jgi:hypothetical protein
MLHNSQKRDELDVDLTQGHHSMVFTMLTMFDIRRRFLPTCKSSTGSQHLVCSTVCKLALLSHHSRPVITKIVMVGREISSKPEYARKY